MTADKHAQNSGHTDLGGGESTDQKRIRAHLGQPARPDRAARPPGEKPQHQAGEQPNTDSGEHLSEATGVGDAGLAHPLP